MKIYLFNFFVAGRQEWELMLGEDEEVVFNITVHNHGESAYESHMYVTHPPGLSFIGTGSEVCDDNQN